ncbi:jg362, partial [Pararge aegeria aegeria]
GLDQRLRKRTASSLPGPKADELEVKRSCASPPSTPPTTTTNASVLAPALPAPALGTAGPVVRAAGALRLQ